MEITLKRVDFETDKVLETTQVNVDYTQEEMRAYEDLFCKCNFLENNPKKTPKYVENYNGVSHGWICPKCKKFTQIG